jgi:glycosyltransferase involved in cell wall biosynthesis
MNEFLRKILFFVLYPFSRVIRMVQNKMDFLRTFRLKLIIARVLRIIRLLNGSAASVQFPDTFHASSNPAGNKKIGFIDHSYHYKTVSPTFFVDLLKQLGSVRVLWDSQWNGGKFPSLDRINQEEFDMLILWQIMIYHDPEKLKKLKCKQIIIIPMYDDIHADPDKLFLRFRDFRFISFCDDLHQRFLRLGIRSKYFQFYIDPASLPCLTDPFTELKGFFWQRTNDITWEHIRKLIGESGFSSFHLHLALDPIWYREVMPSEEDMKKYRITITRWFDKKEDYLSVLSRANVFFTPRLYEGIGMPVIEAMTMGKLVVTPDHPTMNEYIDHGRNGLLYDVQDLKPLDFTAAGSMAARAREDCFTGYEKWKKATIEILDFLTRVHSEDDLINPLIIK